MSEAQIQSNCVRWLWNTHPETRGLFFAVNNNSEHVARAMNRKALGMITGVSDCIFLWKGKAYFIEFKTPEGRQSDAQKEWERKVSDHWFKYIVVRTEDFFQNMIKVILSSKNTD